MVIIFWKAGRDAAQQRIVLGIQRAGVAGALEGHDAAQVFVVADGHAVTIVVPTNASNVFQSLEVFEGDHVDDIEPARKPAGDSCQTPKASDGHILVHDK